ncbi:MAG: rhomboid family intramembrane serine protease [Chthonomonadales bacterium]|nr:rhomboid family intramembrane serine protease [Chthonomonadales bacterium]
MIPLKDNIPTRRFPIVSVALIVLNVLVFLADRLTGHYQVLRVLTPGGIAQVPRFVGGLSEHYALVPAEVSADLATAWPTILASQFLHANWLHIGGNMLYLWIFGNNVEDAVGRARFVLFYLLCGTAAAFAHIASEPGSPIPTVGASGAVAGVMGAYVVLYPRAQVLAIVPVFVIGTLMEVPALIVIGFWALLQVVNARWLGGGEVLGGGGVAYWAHVGGFAAGIVLILLLGGRRLVDHQRRRTFEY